MRIQGVSDKLVGLFELEGGLLKPFWAQLLMEELNIMRVDWTHTIGDIELVFTYHRNSGRIDDIRKVI